MEFIDMNNSIYKNDVKRTIVVVQNNKEYRLGCALQVLFKELKFPLNLTGYLPKFILTAFYILLREIRNKYSKICKI